MDGSRRIADAQTRVVSWLTTQSDVHIRGDPTRAAFDLVQVVVNALNGEHILILSETGWRLEHDLRCRLGLGTGCLFEQPVREWLKRVGGPPAEPGRYVLGLDGKRRGLDTPVVLRSE